MSSARFLSSSSSVLTKQKLLVSAGAALILVSSGVARAATGFFGDGSGGAIFYVTNGSTSGEGTYTNVNSLSILDYGDFVVGSTGLLLRGGEIKTFKNSGGDVTGGTLFYRTFYDGETAPGWSSIALPFNADLGGGDQRWKTISANINLIGSVTKSGSYTTEYYFQMFSNQGNHLLNDGGTFYQTNFDLFYEINTSGSVTQAAPGGATVLEGDGKFVKKGIGTVSIDNANAAYSGAIFLDQGTLQIEEGASLGSGVITIGPEFSSSTGTLLLNDANGGSVLANNLVIRPSGTGSSLSASNASGTNTLTGTVLLNGSVNLQAVSGGALALSNSLSGTGGITKQGEGTVVLSGGSSYSGSTAVNAGTLEVSGAAGALTTTSSINITGGSLLLSGSAANRLNDAAPVSLGGATASSLSVSGSVTETMGALTLASGAGSRVIDFGPTSSVLTFTSLSSAAAAIPLQIWNWTAGGANQLTISAGSLGSNTALSDITFYSGSGTGSLGIATFSGNNLVPVPEPGAVLATLALLAPLAWRERRHWARCRA